MSDQTNTSEIDQAEAFGQRIIEILFLKPVKPGKERAYFETVYGKKTNIGVGRSIIQILEETHNITPKENI